ncbi:MAG: phosphotransferase family protein, partial [Chloroflexota bacterium]
STLDALATMPAGERLCHGDFHPDNVILAKQEPVIIDWIDATCGNPLADVARTSIILLGEAHKTSNPWYQRVLLKQYHRRYLRAYFRLQPGGLTEYRAWRPIVAAARMNEGIEALQRWLAAQVALQAKANVAP